MGTKVKKVDVKDAPMPEILDVMPRTDECAQALRDQAEANWQLYQENMSLRHKVTQLESENAVLRETPPTQPSKTVAPPVRIRVPRFELPSMREILGGRLSPMFVAICIVIGIGIGLVIKVFFG